jgi:hypothetical protein
MLSRDFFLSPLQILQLEPLDKIVAVKSSFSQNREVFCGAGVAEWLMRRPRDLGKNGLRPKGKTAGGLRARRGSSPFPGANHVIGKISRVCASGN